MERDSEGKPGFVADVKIALNEKKRVPFQKHASFLIAIGGLEPPT